MAQGTKDKGAAQTNTELDFPAWHQWQQRAGFPVHWCDDCLSSIVPKASTTTEPEALPSLHNGDDTNVQEVITRFGSNEPCFACANLDWSRYLYRSKNGLDTDRRLEISSKVLQQSAISGKCTECLIIYTGIRNFAATLKNEEYRSRLLHFEQGYSIWIVLRRDKCLRILVHDTINGLRPRPPAGWSADDGFRGLLIIELDFYGPSCEYSRTCYEHSILEAILTRISRPSTPLGGSEA
ncbi:hypothetical protein N431DRAFT_446168 [Stipitochalara longipes BDJ]|nr:hypothetical protein N431DRAFT_446168 [Stipitochalara longipes BDJ]